jgi:hypothetical protein
VYHAESLCGNQLMAATGEIAMSKKKSFKVGRDARNGQFIPVKDAQRRKATAVVETIKKKK